MKRAIIVLSFIAITLLVCLIFEHGALAIGEASVDPLPVPSPGVVNGDPTPLLDFIMNGKYLAAVGAILTLTIGGIRRALVSRIPWLSTQAGGYALGWGVTTLLYVATALQQDGRLSIALFATAVVAGLTASGILDHFRDVKTKVTKPIIAVVALLAISACHVSDVAEHDIIDCAKADQGQILSLINGLSPLLSGDHPNWSAIEGAAESAGITIGGCVLASLVQQFMSARGAAADASASHSAHDALEKFRSTVAHGATFRVGGRDL